MYPTRDVRVRVEGALGYADRFSAVGSGVGENGGGGGGGGGGDDAAGGASYGYVEVSCGGTIMLSGRLPRPIHLNEGEDEIGYDIEEYLPTPAPPGGEGEGGDLGTDESRFCDRVVAIVLPKAVPMAGMTVWWDRPLVGRTAIDVSAIVERGGGRGGGGGADGGGVHPTTATATSTVTTAPHEDDDPGGGGGSFRVAWEEAHEAFRAKAKTRERMVIDV
jgi:hypothetical protein